MAADRPLDKLVRVGAGVALLTGPLGQQVLGQLLISRSTLVEVAGANLALAAVSRHTNVVAQLALNTAVPALVIELLSRQQERRLDAKERQLEQLSQEMAGSLSVLPLPWLANSGLPEEIVQAMERSRRRPADPAGPA